MRLGATLVHLSDLPDQKWGERVAAVVPLRAGASVIPADLIAFVKQRIGSVKAPKQIDLWPDLPRSKVGKILKNEVKRQICSSAYRHARIHRIHNAELNVHMIADDRDAPLPKGTLSDRPHRQDTWRAP